MEDSRTPMVTAPEDLILSIVALAAKAELDRKNPETKVVVARIVAFFCILFIGGLFFK
jgi:hypothetical protein